MSQTKLRELILYVALRSEDDPRFGSTKLNKVLLSADIRAYRKWGRTITGQRYQNLEQGPALKALLPVQQEMEGSGDLLIREVTLYSKYQQKRPIALREPDLSLFTAEEIATVDAAIDRCWKMNARMISDESHRLKGWRIGVGEEFPIASALFEMDDELSDEERRHGLELVSPTEQEKKRRFVAFPLSK